MDSSILKDPGGLLALAFFLGLVVFVCFEAVQLARGRVHVRGIGRAALELLVVSPIIVLMILICNRIAEHFRLDAVEASAVRRWLTCFVLLLIWAPWSHYRVQTHSRRIKHRAQFLKRAGTEQQ